MLVVRRVLIVLIGNEILVREAILLNDSGANLLRTQKSHKIGHFRSAWREDHPPTKKIHRCLQLESVE